MGTNSKCVETATHASVLTMEYFFRTGNCDLYCALVLAKSKNVFCDVCVSREDLSSFKRTQSKRAEINVWKPWTDDPPPAPPFYLPPSCDWSATRATARGMAIAPTDSKTWQRGVLFLFHECRFSDLMIVAAPLGAMKNCTSRPIKVVCAGYWE